MDNIITDELVAAFLEGNAPAAQCQMILDSLAYDEDLRELLAECIAVDEDLAAMNSLKIARERARSRARVARANVRVARIGVRAARTRTYTNKVASVNKIVVKDITDTELAAGANTGTGIRANAAAGARPNKVAAARRAKKKLAAGTAARTASRNGTASRSGAGSRRNRMS